MSTTKDQRLQIRVGPADKALLERAAAASHLNVSAFVLQAAAAKACRAVVGTALNQNARAWWERFGFHPFEPDDPDRLDLYLLTSEIAATLRQAQ